MPVLSDDFLRRVTLGDRAERLFRDTRLPGFALRVRRLADCSISRAFFVIYELPTSEDGSRRRRKILIGNAPPETADTARAKATRMLAAINDGDDPKAQRDKKRGAATFASLATAFETTHLALKPKTTRSDYAGRIHRHILPHFAKWRVCDITPAAVKAFHRKHLSRPTDANRLLAILSSMLSFAIEDTETDWQLKTNPCFGLKRFEEAPRQTWLDEVDLPLFLPVLDKAQGVHAQLLAFVSVAGWRFSEAQLLTWQQLDLKRRVARLEQTKTGFSERPLSVDAVEILTRQERRPGAVYVFAGRGGRPVAYKAVLRALAGLCAEAGIDKIGVHALRATAATWSAVAGASAYELRAAFGWSTTVMADRYVKRAQALGRSGAERTASAYREVRQGTSEKTPVVV